MQVSSPYLPTKRWICPCIVMYLNSRHKAFLGFRCIVTSCRAVLLPRFGATEVMELRDNVTVPDLNSNEVLVRACAVSINPLDTRMRAGYGRSIFKPLLPIILGRDVSGEVADVGSSVRSLRVAQEVFGATFVRGTYADFVILSEDKLTPKPSSLTCGNSWSLWLLERNCPGKSTNWR